MKKPGGGKKEMFNIRDEEIDRLEEKIKQAKEELRKKQR
jgi:hypothetical protein